MKPIVRTVTEAGNAAGGARPLSAFRGEAAFVLLGDPGSGKTFEFRREANALGDAARYFSAREFLRLPAEEPVGVGTLFLDGLDEVRAASGDPREPLDRVVQRLRAPGRRRFRISCRAADWFGRTDVTPLEEAAPGGEVKVLRLEPLRDFEIERLVRSLSASVPASTEADGFLKAARARGFHAWLRNPLALLNSVRAFAASGGTWPDSYREVLEAACERLADEYNDEHLHSGRERFAAAALVDAAGELDAALLLAGAEGCSRYAKDASDDWPVIESLAPSSDSAARAAFGAGLFTSDGGSERFSPAHRQVAEFLGARYLARRIEEGLPVGRVLALLSTDKEAIPSPLRGLAAWLAAHSARARPRLLDRDPVGIAAYGDIHDFTPGEKRRLLHEMRATAPELGAHRFPEDFLRLLAVPEMAPTLRAELESADRGRSAQALAGIAARALSLGRPMPAFADRLMEVARDGTRWYEVTRYALDAFIHNCVDEEGRRAELRRLAEDIRSGVVGDSCRELLGTLLLRMYPEEITPEQVWDYLLDQPEQLVGRYDGFWLRGLTKAEHSGRLPALLAALRDRLPDHWSALESRFLAHLPLELVAQGLEAHGDGASATEIHDWLRLGRESRQRSTVGSEGAALRVREWLEARPQRLVELWREGWERCPETEDFDPAVREVVATLGIARPPEGFGRFCLSLAVEMAIARPLLADWLLERAVERAGAEGIRAEELIGRAFRRGMAARFRRLLKTDLPAGYLDLRDRERPFVEGRRRRDSARARRIGDELEALGQNRASPALLRRLAWEYLGSLEEYLSAPGRGWRLSDPALRRVVVGALARAPWRDDVPDEDAIFDFHARSGIHSLAWPFLAGLEVMERECPERLETLGDDQWLRALAFYFTAPTNRLEPPRWYRELARSRPELTARVLVRWAKAEIAKGSESRVHLDLLVGDRQYAGVARHAALPLLSGFPVRGLGGQLQVLDLLLWAAIAHADRDGLLRVVARKAASKSMTVAQRPHWVAAGLAAAPDAYRDRFETLTRDEEAAREAAVFLCPDLDARVPDEGMDPVTLRLLVTRFGAMFRPEEPYEARVLGLADRAAERIADFIRRLGRSAGADAGRALESLIADRALSRWRPRLEAARDRRRRTVADVGFRHAPAERVAEALRGGRPANAADLSAFVADHLDDLAAEFAGSDENAWRPFWNEDSHGGAVEPKPEESCRDALLGALRGRLGSACPIAPEARHAGGARSDLLVRCDGFAIPIEIKRQWHRDLWTAVREQLIPKYAAMPEAMGRGIYLVLWFGVSGASRPIARPPKGIRPETREQLHRRLVENLTPEERDRVEVRVLDVRPPAARRAEAEAG